MQPVSTTYLQRGLAKISIRNWLCLLSVLIFAGCATHSPAPTPVKSVTRPSETAPLPAPGLPPAKPEQIPKMGGGYYKDDGPIMEVPYDLDALPEPEPRLEPLHRFANKPYSVLGQNYSPKSAVEPFKQRGVASWYGRKFHGQRTSSGEHYDMFKLTAAHPTLPIPSYARVTNLANGKNVIVRINDRGPFHSSRIIDLSYAAAYRLGYQNGGSAKVEVEAVLPGGPPAPSPEVVLIKEAEQGSSVALASTGNVTEDPLAAFAANEVEAPTPAPPANVDVQATGKASGDSVWLQLGAFGTQTGAEAFRAKVADGLKWLAPVTLMANGPVWRVRTGPFPTRLAATQAAERIAREGDLRPVVMR